MRLDYHKVGLLVIRNNRMLLCRKRQGTTLLILPGGCLEPGETELMCLHREIAEELGAVSLENPEFIGTYRDVAAGDASKVVQVELYSGVLLGEPSPHNEIAELAWFGPVDDRCRLAPSIANTILPDLLRRGLLSWPG